MLRSGLLVILCLILAANSAFGNGGINAQEASEPQIGQHAYVTDLQYLDAEAKTQHALIHYLLYLPESYGRDPAKRWPLILYLHGLLKRGDDPNLIKVNALAKILERQPDFPFVVLAPQMPLDKSWQRGVPTTWWDGMLQQVLALLEKVQAQYALDARRVSLTGISMGGCGAWSYALHCPRRFAAVVPVGGWYRWGSRAVPANIEVLKDLPIWIFQGGSDIISAPFQSEVMVQALQKCGGNVRYTRYPGIGHGNKLWDLVYTNQELFDWMLEQRAQ